MKYLLGIDGGGTLIKAGIYDTNGREIAVAQRALEVLCPKEGMTERDAREQKDATYAVIRSALEESEVNASDIVGISVAGQGNGIYLFDEHGNATHNPILSGDMRAKEYVRQWTEAGLVESVFLPKTCQVVWPGQVIALLAWFRDHNPKVLECSKYAVTCKDYIRYLLTGQFRSEITEASGWSCMDIRKGEFDSEIFEAVGLSQYQTLLPPLVSSMECAGVVTKEAARITGLAEGTPVMGGMFDISACAFGGGVLDDSKLCIVIGSWSINEYVDVQPVQSMDFFMSSRYVVPGTYIMTEGSSTSASNLEWFINRLMQEEKAREGKEIYLLVNEMVEHVDLSENALIFLPFLYGTNAGIDAKATFVGLNGIHTKAHMLRAVFEGIVFCHKYHLEKLYKHHPKQKFESVRISGGGTKSALWLQMFADIIQLPMEVSDANELGTMGAAMCAGIGVGVYKDCDHAAEVFVKVAKRVMPNKEMFAYYDKKYELYKKVIEALDGTWKYFDDLLEFV